MSTDHNFWRERRSEAGLNQGPSAYQPNALSPGQTGSPVHRSHILFITVLGTRGRGGDRVYIYIWIARPCALTRKDLRLRTSATTWRINVKEVRTPPVWSNCVATTGSISTAVWNGDRVWNTSCWNMKQEIVLLTMSLCEPSSTSLFRSHLLQLLSNYSFPIDYNTNSDISVSACVRMWSWFLSTLSTMYPISSYLRVQLRVY